MTGDSTENAIYELTGPEALGIADVARILSSVTGSEIRYVDVPEAAARDAMRQAHIPEWQVDVLLELHAINSKSLWDAVTSDVARVTGHSAASFDQFAQAHAQNFRALSSAT